jgi:hypothetical protein
MTKLIIDLITSKKPLLEDSDPCWDNYKQIGLKKKNGKTVPNCVPEDINPADKGEYDNEGAMAKTQLRGIVADASHMIKMFYDEQNLPEWVQNKITKAADYLQSAHSYMMNKDEPIQEKTNMKKIKVSEKLSVSDGMGAWIKDFQDSDAPQFADADEDERRTMAIAAYLAAKREAKSGVKDNTTESTSKYAQSANKILDDLKKANISAADKAKLAQLADLMAKMKDK